ncbi:Golgi-associated PDZ and coiled-coil motif-containing protein-like [Rhopilema esculentum]|uniref:Golgi-associated PDZ and coiled-coil motif-containing protein-like n=1 Tax=Rhopilema esculentum TaxID=499914 RepID=UPI0031DF7685
MAVAVTMFRWLDLLEKEFDKGFVDLDILFGEVDPDQSEITYQGRQKLTGLSSAFAQLAHKAQTVFQANAKLEAELVALRSDKVEANAKVQVLEKELKNTLLQLHAVQLQLHSTTGTNTESDAIKLKLESELSQFRKDAIKEAQLIEETVQFKKENDDLRKYILQMQGEVYGARLAAKYLDKELAGRSLCLQAELVALRSDKVEANAKVQVLEKELKNTLLQLHAVQLQLHSTTGTNTESDAIKLKLESELSQFRKDAIKEAQLIEETVQFKKENDDLRKYILQMQGEVYGARLAAKYLDKELAGRIQQIQLLGRDMRGPEHDLLWNQIEAEIHLHRHKTVIRACRSKKKPEPPAPTRPEIKEGDHPSEIVRKKRGIGDMRIVEIHRDKSEGLGISITGGREHGVPILISEIHGDMPAAKCEDLYIGDAILSVNDQDLRSATHAQAVQVLTRVYGRIKMEVLYVDPQGSDDEGDWENDEAQRYSMLGLVEDPSDLASESEVALTNTRRDPANYNGVNGDTRPDINDVLNLNARIDDSNALEQRLGTDSNAPSDMSHTNSATNSPPSSPDRQDKAGKGQKTEKPYVSYTNTGGPGSAQRYVRT